MVRGLAEAVDGLVNGEDRPSVIGRRVSGDGVREAG